MWGLADEEGFWQQKIIDAHHNMLDVVQSSASKWQVAIAAFLGVYATTGFVLGPDKLSTWPIKGFWEVVSLGALIVAGLAGIVAIFFANLATQGIPKFATGRVISPTDMYELTKDRASRAIGQLKIAILVAGIAGFLAVGTSTWVLVAGATASTPPQFATVTTRHGDFCGTLSSGSDGRISLRLSNGKTVLVGRALVTVVTSCGPS
jgi:hypothetical protein